MAYSGYHNDWYGDQQCDDQDEVGGSAQGSNDWLVDVRGFLTNFAARRREGGPQRTVSQASHQHIQYTMSVATTRSSRLDEPTDSSVFDNSHCSHSEYTGTEDPDANEIASDQMSSYHLPEYPLDTAVPPLECEFKEFNGCRARFRPNEAQELIEHTMSHFPSCGPPATCKCWYCDFVFDADSESAGGDPWLNLHHRMEHVVDCHEELALSGQTPHRDVDQYILQYLRRRNEISDHIFRRLRSQPEQSLMTGLLRPGERSVAQARRREVRGRVIHDNPLDDRWRQRHRRSRETN